MPYPAPRRGPAAARLRLLPLRVAAGWPGPVAGSPRRAARTTWACSSLTPVRHPGEAKPRNAHSCQLLVRVQRPMFGLRILAANSAETIPMRAAVATFDFRPAAPDRHAGRAEVAGQIPGFS